MAASCLNRSAHIALALAKSATANRNTADSKVDLLEGKAYAGGARLKTTKGLKIMIDYILNNHLETFLLTMLVLGSIACVLVIEWLEWNSKDGWKLPKPTLETCHNCGGRMNNKSGFCMDCGTYKGAE